MISSINREMNGHAHGNSKRPERILNGHTNTRTSRCLLFLFFSSNFNFSFLLIFLFIFFLLISSFVSVLLCLYNKFLQMAASKMVAKWWPRKWWLVFTVPAPIIDAAFYQKFCFGLPYHRIKSIEIMSKAGH